MLSFESDYNQGAHPEILRRLCETNFETTSGYGADKFCDTAKEKIKAACEYQNAEVHFLTGGTQTNAIVIDSLIRPYDGVIAAETGHIATHEAGAIEYTGHKVLTIPQHNGKISPYELREYLHSFSIDENRSHMVQPGIVYISHPTEYGTLYTKAELTEISEICSSYSIPLYMDGARLGYGLASLDADLTLPDIARLCDAFYIGGTKVGALFGEAIVFTKNAPKNFMTITKQHGALLAKGRLLGIQFDTLFTDGLYFEISKNAIEKSELMKEIFKEKGYSFYMETSTNQQFILLENSQMEALKEKVAFSFWERTDENHSVVRFATSWATTDEDIENLKAVL